MTSLRKDCLLFAIPACSVVWLMLFYSYCTRVRFALGHWPTSISEDAGLGGTLHYHLSFLLLAALFIAVPVSSVLSGMSLVFSRRLRRSGIILALLIPSLIWAFVTFIDPHGLYAWYLD
jgi:hypothetical protein